MTVLVYGLAVTGAATVRALQARGMDVLVADDHATAATRARASELGVELVVAPDDRELTRLIAACDTVVPAPGVPEGHRAVRAAFEADRRVVTELELAYDWERERPGGPRPMLAVTGTDGKTTTTLLTAAMLGAAGRRTVAAGNTDVPLVEAIDLDLDVLVVECTSFRLAFTTAFRADAAAWLNLAPDHLNWHRDLASYTDAKARLFANQRAEDVAIGWADDPVVMQHLRRAPARQVTFGAQRADYHVSGPAPSAVLTGPRGSIAEVRAMARALPHDITNALAASALVLESGLAGADAVATALAG